MPSSPLPILVTGANSFVGIHVIRRLLKSGHSVRGTARSPAKADDARKALSDLDLIGRLDFVFADLERDENWDAAAQGVERVVHAASPFPIDEPKDEDALLSPAVQGTQRVLRAAQRNGVKRVAQISSVAAVSWGHRYRRRVFSEADWALTENHIGAYAKSKTLAERAAWNFIRSAENTSGMELVVVNPSLILGPLPNPIFRASADLIRTYLLHQVPGVGQIKMGIVDVRDVAVALRDALFVPEAANQRFLLSSEELWLAEIAAILHEGYASRGYKIPLLKFPSWSVKILSLFDKKIARLIGEIDRDFTFSCEKAKQVFGWNPRPAKETILAAAESLIQHKLA
ncbi:MAG: NAD-dependent epimerase/dehydratase family protein [Anaerolineales bacterium]|nr:NAD-dependent epimerase/dehydratase family protein [Anaerolineales bacterium]